MSDTKISAKDVKALRESTGAAMMDAKGALVEAAGDMDKAVEILRVKGQASAAKRSGRSTSEGTIATYIHANGKVGVMVEVQCETDFVARNDDFIEFAREVALHVAGAPSVPHYVSADEIPEEARDAERRVFEAKAAEEGKPEHIVEKIIDGQLEQVVEGGRAPRAGAHPLETATRARRSRSSARSSPPRPARTSSSPASHASRSARRRNPVPGTVPGT